MRVFQVRVGVEGGVVVVEVEDEGGVGVRGAVGGEGEEGGDEGCVGCDGVDAGAAPHGSLGVG